MAYTLGEASRLKLVGVHPIVCSVVLRAIELTAQDFGVYEGVRTLDRQRKLVAEGRSKTLNSMHIPQPDRTGKTKDLLGHAVDLVPWIDGAFRWEWGPCYEIAHAIDQAATEQNVAQIFCWGGVWDRWMSAYGGNAANIQATDADYSRRRMKLGQKVFIDGPHFQITRLG